MVCDVRVRVRVTCCDRNDSDAKKAMLDVALQGDMVAMDDSSDDDSDDDIMDDIFLYYDLLFSDDDDDVMFNNKNAPYHLP